MTRALTLIAVLIAIAGPARAADDRAGVLAEQAVQRNPSIAAIEARIAALQQRVEAAGVWSDPMVAVEYSSVPIDSWALGDHAMSGLQFKLQQTFPFPGKTGLRQETARAEVQQERLRLEEHKVQLRAAVRRAYLSLALTRQLRLVTGSHVKLLDQLIDVVRVKYEVGRVGQHDLLRLQLLRDRLVDELESFDRDARSLVASINAALHRDAGTPVETPERLASAPPPADLAALVALADQSRPLLRRLTQVAATARASARQAQRERYPDITAWVGYRVRIGTGMDEGTDFVSLGLSLPIPWLNNDRRWGSMERGQRAQARSAEAEREAELDNIRGELGAALAHWRRAAREARTYGTKLMPDAHRTLDATLAAYQVDRADFASLYQAELQLLEFERTVRRAEAAAALAEVKVETLVGRPLPRDERSR